MAGIIFNFPSGQIQAEYLTNTLNIIENYYNKLKAVDNTCKLNVEYDVNLANQLNLNADSDILCTVYKDDSVIFTGYLRKSFSITKAYSPKPISIEIVSPSYFLDKKVKTEIFKTNESIGSIINQLGNQAEIELNCNLTEIVPYFRATVDSNIREIIQELLFEYGYTYDFNSAGEFVIYPLFQNIPTEITTVFTDKNCIKEIQQSRTEKKYTGVIATWKEKEFVQNQILYEDTEGGGDDGSCSIKVAPDSYMYGNDGTEGKHNLNYDCVKGEVLYCSSITPNVSGINLSILRTKYENLGDSVQWSCYNPSMNTTATYTKFQFKGNAWVVKAINTTKTSSVDKSLEINLDYLNDSNSVKLLIQNIANYYRKALFNITVRSKINISIGAFCTVTDDALGTITGHVIQKQITNSDFFTYTIESLSDYIPATITENNSEVSRPASDGTSDLFLNLTNKTDALQQQIDNISYNGTTCTLDITNISLEIDDEGFTQTVQEFTTTVKLQRSEMELDWVLGNIELPSGFYVIQEGKQLHFTVGEGVAIKAGFIKIPILYLPIISSEPFVDENDNPFVDENNEEFLDIVYGNTGTQWDLYLNFVGQGYGRYLNKFTTLAQITTSNPNVGDFFTWAGADKTASNVVYGGYLLQGRVYKYIGTGKTWAWEEDKNSGHAQSALSDVLSIANADLEHNNSTVWEFLYHLTSNSAYIDFLVANKAFIELLAAKIITAELVTTGQLTDELLKYETKEELDTALAAYVTNNSLFGDGAAIVDGKINLDSIRNIAFNNGQTLIRNGYINTNVLESEVVRTTYLEANYTKTTILESTYATLATLKSDYASIDFISGGNANLSGFVKATKGLLLSNKVYGSVGNKQFIRKIASVWTGITYDGWLCSGMLLISSGALLNYVVLAPTSFYCNRSSVAGNQIIELWFYGYLQEMGAGCVQLKLINNEFSCMLFLENSNEITVSNPNIRSNSFICY